MAHVEQVCKAVAEMGVIVYNRAHSKLNASMLERLADRCANLIGFKDGVGEIEAMVTIRRRLEPSRPTIKQRWAVSSTPFSCHTWKFAIVALAMR